MKKMVITGANGYLASLVQLFNKDKFEFTRVSRSDVDYNDPAAVASYFDGLDFDVLFHTAANATTTVAAMPTTRPVRFFLEGAGEGPAAAAAPWVAPPWAGASPASAPPADAPSAGTSGARAPIGAPHFVQNLEPSSIWLPQLVQNMATPRPSRSPRPRTGSSPAGRPAPGAACLARRCGRSA